MSHKNRHHEPEPEFGHEHDQKILQEIRDFLREILQILKHEEKNDSIKLFIPNQNGGSMGLPQTLTAGAGAVQCTAVESKAGVPSSTFNGPLAFASDNTAVATIDPASGLLTPLTAGTANISVTDAVGNLTDSDVLTVIAGSGGLNDSIALTIPAQTLSGRFR
jgi:hypothetical protein